MDGLTFALQAGYTGGEYDSIDLDLTGDQRIDAADFALKLSRLSPWTGEVRAFLELASSSMS